jgi:hypothetical protein
LWRLGPQFNVDNVICCSSQRLLEKFQNKGRRGLCHTPSVHDACLQRCVCLSICVDWMLQRGRSSAQLYSISLFVSCSLNTWVVRSLSWFDPSTAIASTFRTAMLMVKF